MTLCPNYEIKSITFIMTDIVQYSLDTDIAHATLPMQLGISLISTQGAAKCIGLRFAY